MNAFLRVVAFRQFLQVQPGSITSQRFINLRFQEDQLCRPVGPRTEQISEFVDYHLHPLVTQTDSYLRDTTDFLLKLSTLNHLPPNCILLTLDVNSLYTNIPLDEGMESCRLFLETRSLLLPPTINLIRMMELILKQNNFTFNNEHYLQVNGTAMGTRMAPSYIC